MPDVQALGSRCGRLKTYAYSHALVRKAGIGCRRGPQISGSACISGSGILLPSVFSFFVKLGLIALGVRNREKVITNLKRVSKPGLRVYRSHDKLPTVLRGLGIAIVSTSQGVMTAKKARKLGIGGEVLAFVY